MMTDYSNLGNIASAYMAQGKTGRQAYELAYTDIENEQGKEMTETINKIELRSRLMESTNYINPVITEIVDIAFPPEPRELFKVDYVNGGLSTLTYTDLLQAERATNNSQCEIITFREVIE